MARTLTIDARFCGPPGLGNGGYVCGVVAAGIDAAAEVTLRRGTPVDRPLVLAETRDGGTTLNDGDDVLVSARPATLDLVVPRPPDRAAAGAAGARYPGFANATYPNCFACGAARAAGDGLRVMPGPIDGTDLLAGVWVPDRAFADDAGVLRPEFLWAALDCPGGWIAIGDTKRYVLLGRLTARLAAPVRAGEPCLVIAWPLEIDGRKRGAGTAVFGADGQLAAAARATWIEMARPVPEPGPERAA